MLSSRSTPPPQKEREQRSSFVWSRPLPPGRPQLSDQVNSANGTSSFPASYLKIQRMSFISASMGLPRSAPMIAPRPPRVDPWSEGVAPPSLPRPDELTRPMPAKACMPDSSISAATWRPFRLPRASRLARQERRRAVLREGHHQRGNGALRVGTTVGAPRYE
jgi:hypothetical protein